MSRIKTALIGCGKRGNGNAKAIRGNERLEMVGLVDPNIEAAQGLKDEFGFANASAYSDHKEMLEKEKPELCAICVWTGLHLPLFRDCAEAGVKAVFLEKPMAGSWSESREIARIAEETGCHLFFSHQRRCNRGNQIAREMFADGIFGRILRMDLYAPCGLLDCGTHTLDQAFSYLGDEVGVQWVHGALDMTEIKEPFGIPEVGFFSGNMMYDNGVLASIFCREFPGQDHWTGLKVFGSKGFMEFGWGGEVNRYAIFDQPDFVPPAIEEDKFEPMVKSYASIVECMETGEAGPLDYRKALRATEVIYAFYESARTHRRIDLPLTGVEGHPLVEMIEAM
ncbi:MAG: Gfo/Idh/MocA family protein [Candidatus Sumerlaeota bacterium]